MSSLRKIRVSIAAIVIVVGAALLMSCSSSPGGANTSAAPAKLAAAKVDGRIIAVRAGNIWLWSDGESRQITRGARYACPSWSSDGRLIAASVVGDNHSDIVVLDEKGTVVRQLTNNLSNRRIQDCAWARSPVWSPDDRYIAYVSDLRGTGSDVPGPTELWLIDSGGGDARAFDNPGGIVDVDYPSWSPDGKFIALSGFAGGSAQVYRLELATGRWVKLTDEPSGALQPSWSPDGKRIACVVRDGDESDIWVMNADGSGAIKLTLVGTAAAPAWSPDGSMVVFLGGKPSSDLFVIRGDGSADGRGQAVTNGAIIDTPSRASWAK